MAHIQPQLIIITFRHRNALVKDLPLATCAGIGDGHDGRALVFELRGAMGVAVAESGRSKEEHRWKWDRIVTNLSASQKIQFRSMKKYKLLERIFFHYNWQWRSIGDAGRRFLCWRATAIADIAVTITNFIYILIWILKCVNSECRSLMTTFICGWDCVWTVIRDSFLCTRWWPCWDCMRLICCRWCLHIDFFSFIHTMKWV